MVAIIKHIDIEGPGLMDLLLKEKGLKTRVIDLSRGDRLPSLQEVGGVVLLGGPMNVYDVERYPFLNEEDAFLKEIVKKEIPFLGICLGAQLLAKACGAKVNKCEVKEVGFFKVALTGEGKKDRLFKGYEEIFSVFQWHEDTFEIPQGAVLLAHGARCRNQAFRIGRCAWGLQFHPEMIKAMLKEWLDYYPDLLDNEAILYDYFKCQDNYLKQARLLCEAFSGFVRSPQVEA